MLLRKRHKDLQGLGVKVVGISADHLPSLRVFDAAQAQFPFPLAADWHRGICRQYGVLHEEKQIARRVLMFFDEAAIARHLVWDFDPSQPSRLDELLQTASALTPS